MADETYRRDATGLLVVDPYNDFISDDGRVWPECAKWWKRMAVYPI